jgi:hypothetical protein
MTTAPIKTPGKKRGTKPGQAIRRDYMRVCAAPDCPRHGEPFPGTAKAEYCCPACKLRTWRARQKAEAAETPAEIVE